MVQTIYDIIEEHGGEIIVNTKASEGTEFNFFYLVTGHTI